MIRKITIEDASAIMDIYNYYVDNSIVTFDIYHASLDQIESKIVEVTAIYPWIVFEENGEILGYAHASQWKAKHGYKHTTETTVYLKNSAIEKGLGTLLYKELIKRLKKLDYRAIIGCITLPNDASIILHENFGFEKVGHFKKVGFKFDKWIDVGYWELVIEEYTQNK